MPDPYNCWKVKSGERETGLEPATSTLGRLHSTVELLPPGSDLKSVSSGLSAFVDQLRRTGKGALSGCHGKAGTTGVKVTAPPSAVRWIESRFGCRWSPATPGAHRPDPVRECPRSSALGAGPPRPAQRHAFELCGRVEAVCTAESVVRLETPTALADPRGGA
jgi:hypothetical protein